MKFLSRFFVAILLAVSFVMISADASLAEIPRQNWSQTCSCAEIEGGILSANCRRINGSHNQTQINTDDFIGNIDGTLMSSESFGSIPRRNWSQTCNNAEIEGGILSANCRRINGSYNRTQINTDNFVGNIDGVLKTNL